MQPAAMDTPPPGQCPKSRGPQLAAQQRSRACSLTQQQQLLAVPPKSQQQHGQQVPAAAVAAAGAVAVAAAAGVRLLQCPRTALLLPTLWLPVLRKLQQVHVPVIQAAVGSPGRAMWLQQ